ncbi:MAG: hypothetical protein AAF975_00510 [Spirochaetota bacterium]
MQTEDRHIRHSFYIFSLLLALLSFLDFATALMPRMGWTPVSPVFSGELLSRIWPYFSLLFGLFLLLLSSRFPARNLLLHSSGLLSLLSFLLIFESFALFPQHPDYSFIHTWNAGAENLLGGQTLRPLAPEDFLPLITFAFWGPALLLLILPAGRFPLLHWLSCFTLFIFAGLHLIAALFQQTYIAGLICSLLLIPVISKHIVLLLQPGRRKVLRPCLLALFYTLLLSILALSANSNLIHLPIPGDTAYLSFIVDMLEIKMFHYTAFFLWLSFPLLFLFLDNTR